MVPAGDHGGRGSPALETCRLSPPVTSVAATSFVDCLTSCFKCSARERKLCCRGLPHYRPSREERPSVHLPTSLAGDWPLPPSLWPLLSPGRVPASSSTLREPKSCLQGARLPHCQETHWFPEQSGLVAGRDLLTWDGHPGHTPEPPCLPSGHLTPRPPPHTQQWPESNGRWDSTTCPSPTGTPAAWLRPPPPGLQEP